MRLACSEKGQAILLPKIAKIRSKSGFSLGKGYYLTDQDNEKGGVKMPYIPQTIQTGRTVEIKKNFVRQGLSAEDTHEANLERAVKKLIRMLNENFSEMDVHITLRYSQQEK